MGLKPGFNGASGGEMTKAALPLDTPPVYCRLTSFTITVVRNSFTAEAMGVREFA